jgi:hypothetical protein
VVTRVVARARVVAAIVCLLQVRVVARARVVAEGVVVVALESVVESAAETADAEMAETVVAESAERSALLLQARVTLESVVESAAETAEAETAETMVPESADRSALLLQARVMTEGMAVAQVAEGVAVVDRFLWWSQVPRVVASSALLPTAWVVAAVSSALLKMVESTSSALLLTAWVVAAVSSALLKMAESTSSALLLTAWVVAAVSSALLKMAESTASNWCSQKHRAPPFTLQLPWSQKLPWQILTAPIPLASLLQQLTRGKSRSMCRYPHLLGHTLLEYALLLLQHAQGALYAPVCVLPCKQQTNVCMIQRPTRLAHQNHLRSACPPMV